MPKLIIDQETMQMVAKRLDGFPIHAGPNGKMLSPDVKNIVDGNETGNPWQPGDDRTRLLVLAVEACRETSFSVERFHEVSARKRILKNLCVPVCNLMDAVIPLQKSFNNDESTTTRRAWPVSDQNTFVRLGRRLRKTHTDGHTRRVRHKLAAHLDLDAFGRNDLLVDPKSLLEALGDALVVLSLAFNHKAHAFSWIRGLGASEDGEMLVVETMFDYPACVRWVTDKEGKVLDINAMFLAEDPRGPLRDDVFKATDAYNYLVSETGVELGQIYQRPIEEVLAEEQGRESP